MSVGEEDDGFDINISEGSEYVFPQTNEGNDVIVISDSEDDGDDDDDDDDDYFDGNAPGAGALRRIYQEKTVNRTLYPELREIYV